jgi:hypothetical protein
MNQLEQQRSMNNGDYLSSHFNIPQNNQKPIDTDNTGFNPNILQNNPNQRQQIRQVPNGFEIPVIKAQEGENIVKKFFRKKEQTKNISEITNSKAKQKPLENNDPSLAELSILVNKASGGNDTLEGRLNTLLQSV